MELLVVVSIIALLLAILLPALGKAKQAAKTVACASNLRQQALGVFTYSTDHRGKMPASMSQPLTRDSLRFYGWAEIMYIESWGGWSNLGRLVDTNIMTEQNIYLCTVEQRPLPTLDYTPWPNPQPISGFPGSGGGANIVGSYSLNPYVYPTVEAEDPWSDYASWQPRAYQKLSEMPAYRILVMDSLLNFGHSTSENAGTWNVGKADGSVSTETSEEALDYVEGPNGGFGYPAWHEALFLLE